MPRYFTFDPSNQWLVVSNQEGGNLVVFRVDAKTGELTQKSSLRSHANGYRLRAVMAHSRGPSE